MVEILVLIFVFGAFSFVVYHLFLKRISEPLSERARPNNKLIINDCLSGEMFYGLDEYLEYENYLPRHAPFFWEVKSNDSEQIFKDNCGNYWSEMGSSIVLSDENGHYIEGKCSMRILIDQEKNVKGNLDFVYHYMVESGVEVIYILYTHVTDENRVEISEHGIDLGDYNNICDVKNELEEQGIYISTNKSKCIELAPLNIPVLFKHGNTLLDGRNLDKGCWFKKYYVDTVDDDLHTEFESLAINDGSEGASINDTLSKGEVPYLWWLTNNIPHKEGYQAFQDVHGNAFYVGQEVNIGELFIHEGKKVYQPTYIKIFFNGYFDVETLTAHPSNDL